FCINTGLMVALGYERTRLAIALVAISTLLFLVAMFHGLPRQAAPETAYYIERNLGFSFIVASLALLLIVYYLLRSNAKSEAALKAKERAIAEQNTELTRLNAELDRFFYSASHDLRAPLTSMQGLIQVMELARDPEELRSYIALLKGRAQSLDHFIVKIGEHARNSRVEIRMEKVQLLAVLHDVIDNLRFYPNFSRIRLELNVDPAIMLDSDPVRLQTIFGNLLSNAIKYHDFTKKDPYIRISVGLEADAAHIRIEDNGTGIRRENLDRIFDMFFREHRRKEGTGLGLYIVRDAVVRLGGKVAVDSIYGEGTNFVVSLPCNRIPQAPTAEDRTSVSQ
ncbi:MAG: HAMP domain-containing histidine kinase, partial [Cyclobacteriaceae bacterium]|nr:HAMP domain-containing histidine kinase [Cyclobacteriaceae bacterium]